MLCSRVQSLLSAYCDYELTGEEMLQIREHLGQCHSCVREHASIRQVKLLLRSLPEKEADQPFVPEVLTKPRAKHRLSAPIWLQEITSTVRRNLWGCRETACHLATGAVLGMTVLAASALQAPQPRDAARAHVPISISVEAKPLEVPAQPLPAPVTDPQLVQLQAPVQRGFSYPSASTGPQLLGGYNSQAGFSRTVWVPRYVTPSSLELNRR